MGIDSNQKPMDSHKKTFLDFKGPNLYFSGQPLSTWSTLSAGEDRLSVAALTVEK